jgi:hypothetical protein
MWPQPYAHVYAKKGMSSLFTQMFAHQITINLCSKEFHAPSWRAEPSKFAGDRAPIGRTVENRQHGHNQAKPNGAHDRSGDAVMSARVLGIDIGSHGTIALLTPAGELLEIADMPILRDGPKGRPNVSAALLADIVLKMQATMAYVEFVSARPARIAISTFATSSDRSSRGSS